jgi:hypothetical protein
MARRIAKAVRRQRERALEPPPVRVRLPDLNRALSRAAAQLRLVAQLRARAQRLEVAALRRLLAVQRQREALLRALPIPRRSGAPCVPAGPGKTRGS